MVRRIRQNGFSLIELAVVVLISGLVMAGVAQSYKQYTARRVFQNYDKLAAITLSLSLYQGTFKKYPAPADPTLSIEDPFAGVECGKPIPPDTDACVSVRALNVNECSKNGARVALAQGGICKVAGARDTAADVDANPDPVLIGAVPVRTLQQSKNIQKGGGGADAHEAQRVSSIEEGALRDALDTDSNYITYAVTEVLSWPIALQPAGANTFGAIRIQTENGASLTSDPAGNAHYALAVPGQNHNGAYPAGGGQRWPCTAGTADAENCNDDAVFVDGITKLAAGAQYYDDIVKYTDYTIAQIWDYTPDEISIYNVNQGNIGIGSTFNTDLTALRNGPKLNVDGIIQVANPAGTNPSGALIVAQPGRLNRSTGDTTGWSPAIFGGDPATGSIFCSAGAGQYKPLIAIKGGQGICGAAQTLPAPAPGQECGSGTFMLGVNRDGSIICGSLF